MTHELIGQKFKVLDDGFIQVVDLMGDDAAIVQAARVSYGAGTKTVSEDRGLIRYLMRMNHSSPFEMCSLKILIRVPMDCWRQFCTHRTASRNEYSTRYSLAIDSQQKTEPNSWRTQSGMNKQGSGDFINPIAGGFITAEETLFHGRATRLYQARIDKGVAREQARKDLPLSTYTEAYWKIDLHNLFHFLQLRMDPHAQLEIRKYADVIAYQIVRQWVPHAWEAFTDYRLQAVTFSKMEQMALGLLFQGRSKEDVLRFGLGTDNKRERNDFLAKLERMGIKL